MDCIMLIEYERINEMKIEVNSYYVLQKGVRYNVFGSTFLPL